MPSHSHHSHQDGGAGRSAASLQAQANRESGPKSPSPVAPRPGFLKRQLDHILAYDHAASAWFHHRSSKMADVVLLPFAMLTGQYCVPAIIPLVAWTESGRLAAIMLVSTLLTLGMTTLSKKATKRDRPLPGSLGRRLFNLRAIEKNFSFPSGDAAQGTGMMLSLYWYARAFVGMSRAWAADHPGAVPLPLLLPELLLCPIPIVMLARVWFGAHWWLDTVWGSIFGATSATASWMLAQHLLGWHFGVDDYREHKIMTWLGFTHP